MAEELELRRQLFGYRPSTVHSLLEDRERMFERVSDEARALRTENVDVRAQVESLRAELKGARDQAQTAKGELEGARRELDSTRKEIESVRGQLEPALSAKGDAEARATGLDSQLRDVRRQLVEYSDRLRTADETIADLRRQLEETAKAAPAQPHELTAVLQATQEAVGRIMEGARRSAEEQLANVHATRAQVQSDIERARSWRESVEPMMEGIRSSIAQTQSQLAQTHQRLAEALRPVSDAMRSLGTSLDELARTAPEPPVSASSDRPASDQRVDLVSHEQEQERDTEEERSATIRPLREGWR